tara:strand:- start:16874 stop:17644 length:771 start_codon:yes stop_codon:yes gene_type:complete
MNSEKRINFVKSALKNKRKKDLIESAKNKNPVESVVSKNLKMDNFLSEQKESLMDDFIFTNSLETPKQKVKNKNISDLESISLAMDQVRVNENYHVKNTVSEIPTLDSVISDLKEFHEYKKQIGLFLDNIKNLVDVESFNKELFTIKESVKQSKSNEILAEEVKQELLSEISKIDSRVKTQMNNAGSGEVRLLNLDDVQGVPADGDILVFDSSINKFRAGPDDDDHDHTSYSVTSHTHPGSVTMSDTMAMAVALGG